MDTPSRRNGVQAACLIEVPRLHAVTRSGGIGPCCVEGGAVQLGVQHVEAHVEVLGDVPLRTATDHPVLAVEIAATSSAQRRRTARLKSGGTQGVVKTIGTRVVHVRPVERRTQAWRPEVLV